MPDRRGVETAIDIQLSALWMQLFEREGITDKDLETAGVLMRAAWAKGVEDALTRKSETVAMIKRYGYVV